jgi:hypothetical protein
MFIKFTIEQDYKYKMIRMLVMLKFELRVYRAELISLYWKIDMFAYIFLTEFITYIYYLIVYFDKLVQLTCSLKLIFYYFFLQFYLYHLT